MAESMRWERPGRSSDSGPEGSHRARKSDPAAKPRTVVLLVILALVTGVYFTERLSEGEAFPAPERHASLRVAMYLTIQTLEAHRDSTGAYPADLESVQLDDPFLTYERTDETYVLEGQLPDMQAPFVYRPGADLAPFRDAFWVVDRRNR